MFNNKLHTIIVAASVAAAALLIAGGASAAAFYRPYPPPTAKPVGAKAQPSGPTPPGVYPLEATAQAVKVQWYDRSTTEQKFVVYERDYFGHWSVVSQAPTRNVAGMSGNYSYLDTNHSMSGQCYMVAAVDGEGSASGAEEQCTVRPDPSQFPQADPASTEQWHGLSGKNDGTGDLYNSARKGSLTWQPQEETGVELGWQTSQALWKIEAQGGPHLMRGQAVALRVWGGGWLRYAANKVGVVGLELSEVPSYQWYVLGGKPGSTIGSSSFALWNSAANDYLVFAHQTYGVDLAWFKETPQGSQPPPPPGVKAFVAYNCISEQRPLEMWVSDLSAGGGWTDMGRLDSQWASGGCPYTGTPFRFTPPKSGHRYEVRAVDYLRSGCSNDPTLGECWRSDTTFVSDANGQEVSTTIG